MSGIGKFLFSWFLAVIFLSFLVCSAPALGALATRSLDRDADPFIVTGTDLPGFIGVPLNQLFVYAFSSDNWQQIPWQFDEIKDNLYVTLDNDELDSVDELVVMGKDCGDKVTTSNWITDSNAQSNQRYEISVVDPLNTARRCWVYVYRSSSLTETVTEDYVNYEQSTQIFTSPVYTLEWHELYLAGKALKLNGSNTDVLDRSKWRIKFKDWLIMGEEDLESEPGDNARPSIVDGRIRAIAGWQGVALDHPFLMFTVAYRSQFYDRVLFDLSWAKKPVEWARLSADSSTDLKNGVYFDANTPLGVVVDGVPDEVPTTPVSLWQQISSETGTVFHAGDISRSVGVPSTYYLDDATVDPEDTSDKKSYGDMGITLTGQFSGIDVGVTHYILPPNQPNVGAMYYDYLTNPLQTVAIEQSFSSKPPEPEKPTAIQATDGTFTDRVRISFNTVTGATVYRIFRCPDNGNTCGLPIGYTKTGTFDDKKAVPGTVYYYRVRACTTTICGKFSVANTGYSKALPAKPTGISATDGIYINRVKITWNAVNDATSYRVFRCTDSGTSCGLPIGFKKLTTFYDLKATPEQVYYYRVKACTTSACSKFSTADSGFVAKQIDKPKDIRATDGIYQDRVEVTWGQVTGASVYRVFRCMDTGQTCGASLGFPKSNNFSDKKGDPGIVYYYRVRACTTEHCSKFSVANKGHRGDIPST